VTLLLSSAMWFRLKGRDHSVGLLLREGCERQNWFK
jgi:hypothetical protein